MRLPADSAVPGRTSEVEVGRLAESLHHFDVALTLKPDYQQARLLRSTALLLSGDYARGWHEYECRLEDKAFAPFVHNAPLWDGSPLAGRTLLVTDLDLAFGTAGLNFNQDSTGGIVDALLQPDRVDATLIDRLLTKLGDKLSLLSGPGSVDKEINIESHAVETVLSAIRGSVPCVVVDVPNMWAPWIKYTLVHADQVVITATPDLPCLRNTKNLVDLLKQSRPNDNPPRIILNQVGVPKRPEISAADFSKAIGADLAAIIPYDAQTFGTAQSNGSMIFEVAAKSKAADALNGFVQSMTGTDKPAKAKKIALNGLVGKLPLLSRKK